MGNALDDLKLLYRGKGKDMHEIPGHPDKLLQVMTNRISTHNVVHLSEIPEKGELINSQTLYMALAVFPDVIDVHILSFGRKIYEYLPVGEYPPDLHFRSMVVLKREVTPIEFIWRNYLTGSLYKAYQSGEDPYGLNLPPGLPLMYRFPEKVFTPTEKSKTDDPLKSRKTAADYSLETQLTSLAYKVGQGFLRSRGITLVDGKFEASRGMLVDDWLNGDCCRMCLDTDIKEGIEPPFLDKERFRSIALKKWNGGPKVPLKFSEDEIKYGVIGYHEAFVMITRLSLPEFRAEYYD